MNALDNVLSLRSQEQQPLFSFRQFFEGHHVDRAKALKPCAQFFNPGMPRFKIEIFSKRMFAREVFKRLVEFGRAIFMNEGKPRLRFGPLNLDRRSRITHLGRAAVQLR